MELQPEDLLTRLRHMVHAMISCEVAGTSISFQNASSLCSRHSCRPSSVEVACAGPRHSRQCRALHLKQRA